VGLHTQTLLLGDTSGGWDKVKKRRYYRYVAKEKLRLAEQGFDQDVIKAVCRYLSGLRPNSGVKIISMIQTSPIQLQLQFE